MEPFWLGLTNLGRDEVFIAVLALYTLLVNPAGGRSLGVAFALSYLVNTALKYGLNLPRPFTDHPEAASAAARATAGGPGLPSGHAQMSATLWLGLAWQVRQWRFTIFAALLTLLIVLSRLALHVHFVSDVVVGTLLGLAFAGLAVRGHFVNTYAFARWGVPLLVLALAAFLPQGTPREYSAGLGMLAGFWAGRPDFAPPRDWAGRLWVGLLGLLLTFAAYFGLSAAFSSLGDAPVLRALRYGLLVLFALHGIPLLLRRWLPLSAASASPASEGVRA